MEKNPSSFKPTFILKGIDTSELANRFLSGKYSKNKDEGKYPINFNNNIKVFSFAKVYGNSEEDEIYTYVDNYNKIKKIFTTNHKNYICFRDEKSKENSSCICHWCRKEYINSKIGVPISMNKLDNRKYIFYVYGDFCSFECCYAYIKEHNSMTRSQRKYLYDNSESLLKTLYNLIYSDKEELKSAPDWRFLKEYGGSLDREEFHSKNIIFTELPNIIFSPIKKEIMINDKS